MQDIVILGAGGMAREVALLIADINRDGKKWHLLGYAERGPENLGKRVGSHTIKFTEDELADISLAVVPAIGDPRTLLKVMQRLLPRQNLSFPNLIHPSVSLSPDQVRLGGGNVICAGCVLTSDIEIGSFNIINPLCTLAHDCRISDGCMIAAGCSLSGDVRVGSGCLLGTGARVLQGIGIGASSVIGAGAVVTRDVPANTTVTGVPARPLEKGS